MANLGDYDGFAADMGASARVTPERPDFDLLRLMFPAERWPNVESLRAYALSLEAEVERLREALRMIRGSALRALTSESSGPGTKGGAG